MNQGMKKFALILIGAVVVVNFALASPSVAPAPVSGTDGSSINGDGANNLRVNLETAIPAGTAIIGKMGIDQTTPGTTNGVQVNAALPAGGNTIGNVGLVAGAATIGNVGLIAGSATVGAVKLTDGTLNLSMLNSAPGSDTGQVAVPVRVVSQLGAGAGGSTFGTRSDTFTATGSGTTVDSHLAPVKYFSLSVAETGTVTSWTVVLECSLDDTTFTTVLTHTNTSGNGATVFGGTTAFPCLYFRSRASAITLGAGTNVIATILGM